jgi:hypothetical protein
VELSEILAQRVEEGGKIPALGKAWAASKMVEVPEFVRKNPLNSV